MGIESGSADDRLSRAAARWNMARSYVRECWQEQDPVRQPEHLWSATAVAAGASGDVATARWLAAGEPVSPRRLTGLTVATTLMRAELDLLLWQWEVAGDPVDRLAMARVDEIGRCLDESRAILADLPDAVPVPDRPSPVEGRLGELVANPESVREDGWFRGPDECA